MALYNQLEKLGYSVLQKKKIIEILCCYPVVYEFMSTFYSIIGYNSISDAKPD